MTLPLTVAQQYRSRPRRSSNALGGHRNRQRGADRPVNGTEQGSPERALSVDELSHRVGAAIASRQLTEIIVTERMVRHGAPFGGRLRQAALDVVDQLEQVCAIHRRIAEPIAATVPVRVQARTATGNDGAFPAGLA